MDERGVGGCGGGDEHCIRALRNDCSGVCLATRGSAVETAVVLLARPGGYGCAAAAHAEADDDHDTDSQQRLPLAPACGQSEQEDACQGGAAASYPPAGGRLWGGCIAGNGVTTGSTDIQGLADEAGVVGGELHAGCRAGERVIEAAGQACRNSYANATEGEAYDAAA